MKNILLLLLLPVILAGSMLAKWNQNTPASATAANITVCMSPIGSFPNANAAGKFIGRMPGWGKYTYPISTKSDSAQCYFDQGLNLYYSYHMKESLASFKEAARLDPANPMTYWGQALAAGPYYNAAHTYKMPAEMPEVMNALRTNLSNALPKEKALAGVMALRYSADLSDVRRANLNGAYAKGMRQLVSRYPDDNDIKMLYVDAVMLMHAWDFWQPDGTHKPWTPELIKLTEQVMKKSPDHPAALHYHIHLTEASHQPEAALPNADKLKNLFPGVAHMVHMASHAYQRNGLYAEGVEVNDLADKNLLMYDSLAQNLGLVKHSPHYFAVQTYCALTGGMYVTGLRDALRCRKSVSPTAENNYDQYLFMLPAMTLVRLGKWKEVLATAAPDPAWIYATLLDDFARGLSYAQTGDLTKAKQHLEALQIKAKNPVLTKRRIPFNAPSSIAVVAQHILEGTILFYEKDETAAYAALSRAITAEDALIYTEPSDWPLPARQFLGAFLLKNGKAAEAEKIYRKDLIHNPGNGWSLLGLSQSLEAQKKNASALKTQYAKAFSKAERIPSGSVILE